MITCTSYIAANGPFSKHARGTKTTGLEAGDATDDGNKSMEEAPRTS
jgi:hypothetical protein